MPVVTYLYKLPVLLIRPPAFACDVHHILEMVHDLLPVAATTYMGRYLCPVLAIQAEPLSDPLLLLICERPPTLCVLICLFDMQQAGHSCPACA